MKICGAGRKRKELLARYEEIGTPEEFQDLKEKNRKKLPEVTEIKPIKAYACPRCGYQIVCKSKSGWFLGRKDSFCPCCGQGIDWSRVEV